MTSTSTITPPPAKTYGRLAAGAMAWVGITMVVGKLASFLAQYALGFRLSKRDYALVATAMSVSGILLAFRELGVQKLLIQHSDHADQLARPYFRLALLTDLLIAAALLAAAPFVVRFYHDPSLFWLIAILALSTPLAVPACVQTARASVQLKLSAAARAGGVSAILRQASTVLFAFLGLGPASLLLPFFLTPLYEWAAFNRIAGPIPAGRPITRPLVHDLLRSSRWVVLGTLAISFISSGDYLVLSKLADDEILGVYYFGFQLTVSIAAPFSSAVLSVLAPAMAKLKEPERRRQAYLRTTRLLSFASAVPCIGMALVAQPVVHILWHGKWDASVPVVQIMSVTLIIMLFAPLAVAVYEAYGHWRLRAVMLVLDGLGVMASAALGCWLGGVAAIAVCVGVHRILIGLIQGILAAHYTGISPLHFLRQLLPPVLSTSAAGLATHLLIRFSPVPVHNPYLLTLLYSFLFCLLQLALGLTLLRRHWAEVLDITGMRRFIPKMLQT